MQVHEKSVVDRTLQRVQCSLKLTNKRVTAMKKFLLFGGIATMLSATSVQAQPFQLDSNQIQGAVQGMLMQSMFNITDANKDGQVSKAEAIATAEKRFDEADANRDGVMTKQEMESAHQRQMQMRQQRQQTRGQSPFEGVLNGGQGSDGSGITRPNPPQTITPLPLTPVPSTSSTITTY
jgi:EF hand